MADKPLLTDAYKQRVENSLLKKFSAYLQSGETMHIKGVIESDGWTLTVTFENADQSLHLPVETALGANENPKCTNDEARDILVDFIGYYFDRYFQGARHVTLPIDWKPFPFGEYTIRARGWERNLKLEDAADRFLAGEDVSHLIAKSKQRS